MINLFVALVLLLLSNLFTLVFTIKSERKKAKITYDYYCGFYEQNKKLFEDNERAKFVIEMKDARIKQLEKEIEKFERDSHE